MSRRYVLAFAALLCGSCATTHSFTAPDGRRGYTAICERNWQSKADCHAYAREACGGDYDVLSETRYTLDVACKA